MRSRRHELCLNSSVRQLPFLVLSEVEEIERRERVLVEGGGVCRVCVFVVWNSYAKEM